MAFLKKNLSSNETYFVLKTFRYNTRNIKHYPMGGNQLTCLRVVVLCRVYIPSLTYHEQLRSGPAQPKVILGLSIAVGEHRQAPSAPASQHQQI